jgi:hypothetical protein
MLIDPPDAAGVSQTSQAKLELSSVAGPNQRLLTIAAAGTPRESAE